MSKTTTPPTQENQGGQRPQGKGIGVTAPSPETPEGIQGQVTTKFPFSLSLFFLFPFSFLCTVFPLYLALAHLCGLPPLFYRVCAGVPPSNITQVEVRLLYPPVGWDLLRLVALHVLLHGGEAGAVLRADGALVG